MASEITSAAAESLFQAASNGKVPILSAILEAKKQATALQAEVIKEVIYDAVTHLSAVKQKTLRMVNRWLDEFSSNPENLHKLTPQGAKTLLSIAYTADQMIRLENNQSTSNVAVVHKKAEDANKLAQTVDKLKQLDPVFDYDNLEVKPVDLKLPEIGLDGPSSERERSAS